MKPMKTLIAEERERKRKMYIVIFDREQIYKQIDVTDQSEDNVRALLLNEFNSKENKNKIAQVLSIPSWVVDIDECIRKKIFKKFEEE